jgi:hypothetical protein
LGRAGAPRTAQTRCSAGHRQRLELGTCFVQHRGSADDVGISAAEPDDDRTGAGRPGSSIRTASVEQMACARQEPTVLRRAAIWTNRLGTAQQRTCALGVRAGGMVADATATALGAGSWNGSRHVGRHAHPYRDAVFAKPACGAPKARALSMGCGRECARRHGLLGHPSSQGDCRSCRTNGAVRIFVCEALE